MNVQIEPSWKEHLQPEFDTAYFKQLTDAVRRNTSRLLVTLPATSYSTPST